MDDPRGAGNRILVHDRLPLLIVEFFGAPDDDQFAAYLAELEAITARQAKRPFDAPARRVVIFDSTHSTRPVTASQRRMQAAFMKRMKEVYGDDAGTGVCFVMTNTVVRGVFTAILWLQPMSYRFKVVASRAAANAWAHTWITGSESLPPPTSA